jgi:hypothetical protein
LLCLGTVLRGTDGMVRAVAGSGGTRLLLLLLLLNLRRRLTGRELLCGLLRIRRRCDGGRYWRLG